LLSLLSKFRIYRYQISGNCVNCDKCYRDCSVCVSPSDNAIAKDGCLSCGECKVSVLQKQSPLNDFLINPTRKRTSLILELKRSKISFHVASFKNNCNSCSLVADVKSVLRPPGSDSGD